MQDLQLDLQNAMNLGDQRRVVEVSTKLAEGVSQMVCLDGRCGKVTRASQDGEQMRTTSRCGFRGVRLGEASHPGPFSSKRRRMLQSRAMRQSWDSGGDSSETHRVTQVDSPPSDVLAARE